MSPERLAALRNTLELSQQELAAALNLKTFATVNRWEKGHREIPKEEARLLECLEEIVKAASRPKSNFTVQELSEAVRTTGVANVVAKAATAGLLKGSVVGALATLPAFYWLGGLLGVGVGAVAMTFFTKLATESKKEAGENEQASDT